MRVNVHIPEELDARVRRLAKEEGLSLSAFFARAAERYADELERREAFEAMDQLIEEADVSASARMALHKMRCEEDRTF